MDAPYYVGFQVGDQQLGLDPHGHDQGLTGPVPAPVDIVLLADADARGPHLLVVDTDPAGGPGGSVPPPPPLSAIALHAETSSLTAIGNDYGPAEAFARQVAAHGRPGDTLLLLSASGRSDNVLAAADRARLLGIRVWAMTGPAPNPLASAADDAICVAAPDTSTVQEVHLVAIHALCGALDAEVTSL